MSNIKFKSMKETTFIEGQKCQDMFSVKLTFMRMQSKGLKVCMDIATQRLFQYLANMVSVNLLYL